MKRKVILSGQLGDLFGREWNIHCTTPAQALSCIRMNCPGMDKHLIESDQKGLGFVAHINDDAIGIDRFLGPLGASQTLYISPALQAAGNGKGWLQILGGIALIAISVFIPVAAGGAAGLLGTGIGAAGTAGLVGNLGLALVLGGTATLLTPTPEFGEISQSTENKPSYLFDGPTNNTRQGNVRPVCYGEMIIGGQPISFGVRNEEWIDPEAADNGTPAGYADGNASGYAGDDAAFRVNGKYGGYVGSGGGKGGGGAGGSPREAPDSYRSISYVRAMDFLCEGEIAGPMDEYGNLLESAEQLPLALFFDQTPLVNDDGTYNFKNVKAFLQTGTPDQKHIPGFEGTEIETSVGTEAVEGTPISSTITDPTTDAVRATMRLPQMYNRNQKNGNVDGATVEIAWEVSYDGGGFSEVIRQTIRQKNTNPVLRSWRIDLATFVTSAAIRLVRISDDQPESHIQNRTFFESLTRIQDEKLRHPNSAKLGLDIDASQFSRIPSRAIRIGGTMIRVPNNYDPINKTYTGIWNFGFVVAYSNNPAWVFLDALTQKRYGLGRWIDTNQNDLRSLYEIGQNSDVLVTQGIIRSVVLAEALTLGATSMKISPPSSWIEDGQTLTTTAGSIALDEKVRRGRLDAPITTGSLILGASYRILTMGTGSADFEASGAETNQPNLAFTANSTAPTWGSGATLQPLYTTIAIVSGFVLAQGDTAAFTGMEPRFEANLMIASQKQAYEAIQDLGSIFAGMTFWGGGLYKAVQDAQRDSTLLFTNANIVDTFKVTGSALKSRHTTALVRYNEKEEFYRARPIYVEDSESVFLHGIKEKKLTAFGCTSESQAMRAGRRVILTERKGHLGIEFTAGIEAHLIEVGHVVTTIDNTMNPAPFGGRLRSVSSTSAELDREVVIEAGFVINLVAGDASGILARAITTAAGPTKSLSWVTPIPDAEMPTQNSVWMLEDTVSGTERKWRVLSVSETSRNHHQIIGLLYDETKYAEIEKLERQAPRTPLDQITRVRPPLNLDVITERIVLDSTVSLYATATWDPSPDVNVRSYVVTSRRDDGDWEPFRETFSTNLRIPLDAPGSYEFQVQAVNGMGFRSGPATTSFAFTDDGLVVGATTSPRIEPRGGVQSDDATGPLKLIMINNEGQESEIRFTFIHEVELSSPGPLIVGQTYEITVNTGSPDFTLAGSADNNVGTVFTATGQPTWGTGTVRLLSDSDPLNSVAYTIFTYNPNCLTRSQEFTHADWVKADGTVTNSTRELSPDGDLTVDFIQSTSGPSGRFEITQQIDIEDVAYRGQSWVFSIWEAAQSSISGFTKFTIEIEDFSGQPTGYKTVAEFAPSYSGLVRREVVHEIVDEQISELIIRIIAENADNPSRSALFVWGAQLQAGKSASGYKATTTAGQGIITDDPDANTATIRARTFITDGIYSGLSAESYDSLTGQTECAQPHILPLGGTVAGTDFPLPITLKSNEPGSALKYTTDGTDPATGATYTGVFDVTEGTTVRAIATKATFTDSQEREETYNQGF